MVESSCQWFNDKLNVFSSEDSEENSEEEEEAEAEGETPESESKGEENGKEGEGESNANVEEGSADDKAKEDDAEEAEEKADKDNESIGSNEAGTSEIKDTKVYLFVESLYSFGKSCFFFGGLLAVDGFFLKSKKRLTITVSLKTMKRLWKDNQKSIKCLKTTKIQLLLKEYKLSANTLHLSNKYIPVFWFAPGQDRDWPRGPGRSVQPAAVLGDAWTGQEFVSEARGLFGSRWQEENGSGVASEWNLSDSGRGFHWEWKLRSGEKNT